MLTFTVANLPIVAQAIALLIFPPRYFASHLHVSLAANLATICHERMRRAPSGRLFRTFTGAGGPGQSCTR